MDPYNQPPFPPGLPQQQFFLNENPQNSSFQACGPHPLFQNQAWNPNAPQQAQSWAVDPQRQQLAVTQNMPWPQDVQNQQQGYSQTQNQPFAARESWSSSSWSEQYQNQWQNQGSSNDEWAERAKQWAQFQSTQHHLRENSHQMQSTQVAPPVQPSFQSQQPFPNINYTQPISLSQGQPPAPEIAQHLQPHAPLPQQNPQWMPQIYNFPPATVQQRDSQVLQTSGNLPNSAPPEQFRAPVMSQPGYGVQQSPHFVPPQTVNVAVLQPPLPPFAYNPQAISMEMESPAKPKKVLPNWLVDEIKKKKAFTETVPAASDKKQEALEEAERVRADNLTAKEASDDEAEREAENLAEMNHRIKRVMTDVLLRVTDSLMRKLAVRICQKAVSNDQIYTPERRLSSRGAGNVEQESGRAKAKFSELKTAEGGIAERREHNLSDESSSPKGLASGNLSGLLGGYASSDEEGEKDGETERKNGEESEILKGSAPESADGKGGQNSEAMAVLPGQTSDLAAAGKEGSKIHSDVSLQGQQGLLPGGEKAAKGSGEGERSSEHGVEESESEKSSELDSGDDRHGREDEPRKSERGKGSVRRGESKAKRDSREGSSSDERPRRGHGRSLSRSRSPVRRRRRSPSPRRSHSRRSPPRSERRRRDSPRRRRRSRSPEKDRRWRRN